MIIFKCDRCCNEGAAQAKDVLEELLKKIPENWLCFVLPQIFEGEKHLCPSCVKQLKDFFQRLPMKG